MKVVLAAALRVYFFFPFAFFGFFDFFLRYCPSPLRTMIPFHHDWIFTIASYRRSASLLASSLIFRSSRYSWHSSSRALNCSTSSSYFNFKAIIMSLVSAILSSSIFTSFSYFAVHWRVRSSKCEARSSRKAKTTKSQKRCKVEPNTTCSQSHVSVSALELHFSCNSQPRPTAASLCSRWWTWFDHVGLFPNR